MITHAQIRAARALLDWSTAELAARTGLTVNGINKIERGHVQAHRDTIEKMIQVFASSGLEFTENQGVRVKPSGLEVYEGPERFEEFYDFLYEHLKTQGGDVCLSVTNENLLSDYRKDPELHRKRMHEIVQLGSTSFRILASESKFISTYAKYKWIPKYNNTAPTSFYAFGDCLALISFVHINPPHVVLIQSAALANAYRESFDINWTNAKDPPKHRGDK